MKLLRRLLFVVTAVLGLAGCGGGDGGGYSGDSGGGVSAPLRVPPPVGEQWTLAQPADVGMDAGLLGHAVSDLPAPSVHGLASMLVVRHGKPVLEQYWNGYDENTAHDLRSATKSITGLLIGIAIDGQALSGVDAPISNYLSAVYPNAPALKQGITIENLLTMSSGLACDDFDTSSPGYEGKMYQQTDWVQFFLNLDSIYVPGSVNQYCTGSSVALGRVLVEASKQTVPAFANARLFGPLGIASTSLQWADYDNHTQTDTGGHIKMRPRDMSKIGQMVLQGGMWNGTHVVSSNWIAAATSQHGYFPQLGPRGGYGYLWWLSKEQYKDTQVDVFRADGNGGQYIFVIPALDMVVVFTGENYDSPKDKQPFDILTKYVIPAVLQ